MPIPAEAWNDLPATLDRIALQVARKLNMDPPTRVLFMKEAAGYIAQQAVGYDASRGALAAWCYRVLYHYGVDVIRREAAQRDGMKRFREEVAVHGQRWLEPPEYDDTPQIDVVAALERHVNGRDRILVAIDCQLLGGLAMERRAIWLDQADLPPDFPWQDLERIAKQADRRSALVACLGVNAGWLRQRIYRALKAMRVGMEGDDA